MEISVLYDSDDFVVAQITENSVLPGTPKLEPGRFGFEIVAKKPALSVYLSGAFADVFTAQIKAWQEKTPEQSEVEAKLETYAAIMTTPLVLH